ncbi:glycosyltransferase family 4 protein [Glutamicibacter arilaitensis]|uniref:glycosyltransferase family 4 protein n=1 Tax=Glutamicibacter arilaitensis TaxID=256701 RepID=UPI003FD333B4
MSSSNSPAMKVLLLTHSYSPEHSPPQRRWKAFLQVFTAKGISVCVVAPKNGGLPQENEPGIKVVRYPSFGRPKRLALKALRSVLQSAASIPVCLMTGRKDVVIATVPALSTLLSGYIVSRLLGAKFVVDLRDSWPNLLSESNVLRSSFLEPLITRIILFLLRHADLVVTVTRGLGEVAKAQGAKPVTVISNGVDQANYTSAVPHIHRDDELLNVLYLGNLGLSQGLDLVVRAVAGLSNKVRVRFVGDGTERERLQQLAASLNAPVEFLHPVRGEQVLEQYAWADTCVVSLRPDWQSFEHTIPSKLYELLYFDRHITGLVRGEAANIIAASAAGNIVGQDLGSLMEHLENLRTEIGQQAHRGNGPNWVVEHASLERLGEKYVHALSTLLGHHQ